MRLRHISWVLCSLALFTTLLSSCAALRKRHHRLRRRNHSFPLLKHALGRAYRAQVDLIRRGMPSRVVQAEFTWAINYFLKNDPSFVFQKLKDTCVHTQAWNRVFDDAYRAKFVIKYLHEIRRLSPNITFLNFESYPSLPPMDRPKRNLVRTMWLTSIVRLRNRPRSKYKVSDFPFPKTVDVLHDPAQREACRQYHKFGKYSGRAHYADAKSVLIALTVVSVNMYHMGGNPRSIAQMLKHFVGYVFNGVRCLRLEGVDIKVSTALVEAYSRNIAMIRSTVTKKGEDSGIKAAAVEHVFRDEIHSLLSYNSWGHLNYAVLSPKSSIPVMVNSMTKIFGLTQYRLLLLYSKSPNLLTPQRFVLETKHQPETIRQAEQFISCGEGYILMPRRSEVKNPLECCCNKICYRWSQLIPSFVSYSADRCCSRCNEFNRCDSGITGMDMSDNTMYSFFVPEYGEQEKIDMFLVAL